MSPTHDGRDARARDAPSKETADRQRADRVRVAPQQEGRRSDLGQPVGEVGPIIDEPGRRVRLQRPIFVTPLGCAETCHVDATRGRDQDQTCDALRPLQCQACGEDSPHRLRDDVACSSRQPLNQPAEQVVQRLDTRIGWEATEAWVAEEVNLTKVGQLIGHRPPERRASTSAGEEYERWHGGEPSVCIENGPRLRGIAEPGPLGQTAEILAA